MKEPSKSEKDAQPRHMLVRTFFNVMLGVVFLPVFFLTFLGTFLWGWMTGGGEGVTP